MATLGLNNAPSRPCSGLCVPTLQPRSPCQCLWLLPRQPGKQASIDSGSRLEECPFVEHVTLLLPVSCPQERCSGRKQPGHGSFPRGLRGQQGTEQPPSFQRKPPSPALSSPPKLSPPLPITWSHCVIAQSQISQWESPLHLSRPRLNDRCSVNPHTSEGSPRGGSLACSYSGPLCRTWNLVQKRQLTVSRNK